ncbi:hypothetical protein GOP47_0021784 [Adiantum capillus-veneris]|uniref:Uncharacterized protein n=1 Tax=Adiantum capillus-veneris TaxID=13818 RepID=A0A9D4U902_ADICA|nr:hypothetical protein GOP47_0021784 [Adiantum capillus-veneris]
MVENAWSKRRLVAMAPARHKHSSGPHSSLCSRSPCLPHLRRHDSSSRSTLLPIVLGYLLPMAFVPPYAK